MIGSAGVGARVVSGLLFVTILCSPFVLIEPSFYEVGILFLGIAYIAFGVTMHRQLLPLILLLLLWSDGNQNGPAKTRHTRTKPHPAPSNCGWSMIRFN